MDMSRDAGASFGEKSFFTKTHIELASMRISPGANLGELMRDLTERKKGYERFLRGFPGGAQGRTPGEQEIVRYFQGFIKSIDQKLDLIRQEQQRIRRAREDELARAKVAFSRKI